MDKSAIISKNISDSIQLKQQLLSDKALLNKVDKAVSLIVEAYRVGAKVLFCGNGGSAADAQHLAAELSGRFYYDRPPLEAEALHVNTSFITAVGNDYSYDVIFERMTEASGKKGDVLIGLSTSGNSKNVVLAFKKAKSKGMKTIGLTGIGGGELKALCDILIDIPSADTPRIQECHMLIGHSICQLVEAELFPKHD